MKSGMNQKKSQGGYTLGEMLVYISVLVIILGLVINTLIIMMRSYNVMRTAKNIETSATVSLERISREVRNALSVEEGVSVFGVNPGKLVLSTLDEDGDPLTLTFFGTGNTIYLKKNSDSPVPLTASSTEVTTVIFRHLSGAVSEAVRIEMAVAATSSGAFQSKNFYDTVIVRGSYNGQ